MRDAISDLRRTVAMNVVCICLLVCLSVFINYINNCMYYIIVCQNSLNTHNSPGSHQKNLKEMKN